MKVLLVNGSPHASGCTFTALAEVADALNRHDVSTEIFWIGNDLQGGCIDCGYCRTNGRCFRQDSVQEFVEKSRHTDGFIFGSPVHFAAPSGNLLSFMGRVFFSTFDTPIFAQKPAASVVSCRRAGSSAALDTLNKFYSINRMPIVPSQYWNMVHGTTPEEVRADLEGLQIMRTLGANMAWLLQSLAIARSSGVQTPVPEARLQTNFIR